MFSVSLWCAAAMICARALGLIRVKAGIPVLASLSAVAGYIVAAGSVSWELAIPALGIYLLAAGASALNQVQDRSLDALMDRTKGRPIPMGRIGVGEATAVSILLLVAGFGILVIARNPVLLGLGAFAVLWYNGVYTYLKRVTAFAAVPGGLIGSVPPVAGWVAAGGAPLDPGILLVAAFFFLWQIPHFWLLLLKYGRDYEKAGLPTMTKIFAVEQLARLTFVWVLATAASTLLLPVVRVVTSLPVLGCLLASTAWLVWGASKILRKDRPSSAYRIAFHEINFYVLLVLGMISIDRFI